MRMSTTPFPGPYPTTMGHILVHHITNTPGVTRRTGAGSRLQRRRPSRPQGHALEVLGHAIEYLVDQQLHRDSHGESQTLSFKAEAPALHILARLSREVFAGCPEAASLRPGLKRRLLGIFPAAHPA